MNIEKLIENLKHSYNSGWGDDLGKDFYSPMLNHCEEYNRMTGEFTSNVIFDWGKALLKVLNSDNDKCIVKIIANPSLNAYDLDALRQTLNLQNDDKLWDAISDKIYEEAEHLVNEDLDQKEIRDLKLKIFSYLIASKKLVLKFGFPRHVPNPNMLHIKQGIFVFKEGLKVSFNGSGNETHGGYKLNVEKLDVFTNLKGEDPHLMICEKEFNEAWNGKAPGFLTKTLSQKTLDKIKTYAPSSKFELNQIIKKVYEKQGSKLSDLLDEDQIEKLKKITSKPLDFVEEKENYLKVTKPKWEFQKKAREKFILAKSGILEMATGTGKTRTSLSIITQLIKDKKINKIIIQAEKNNLLSQWEENIKEWLKSETYKEINFLKFTSDKNQIEEFISGFMNKEIDLLLVSKYNLPSLLEKISNFNLNETFIIHDEVHGLFSEKFKDEIEGKQSDIEYRLGLSATIKNEHNPERTKILFSEIGEVVYEYPIAQAIEDGVLVEFDLISLNYQFLDQDKKDYQAAWANYEIDIKNGANPKKAEEKRNIKMADIKKNCVDKVRVFKNNLTKLSKFLHRSFIFADEEVYVEKVLDVLIHEKINFKTHTGNSGYENINKFSKGEVDCLLNCEKLSEGIDVKSVNTIVLFATPQGIQLMQRLGRVLRSDSKYPNKRACVIDFFLDSDMEKEKGSDYNRYLKLKKLSEIKKKN